MKPTDYWADDIDGYTDRNSNIPDGVLLNFFSDALDVLYFEKTDITSVCEYGCNIGRNLKAVKDIYPSAEVIGYDINRRAIRRAKKIPEVRAKVGSILKGNAEQYDLVFTKGCLIHIHPDDIGKAYQTLYDSAKKFILLCEYYNPYQVEVEYRGQNGLLWKRDFCSEMLDKYEDLTLIDYGFRYHRDVNPQDDVTWFLIQKETK